MTITPGHMRRAKVTKRSPWTRHEPARELTFITERTLPPWSRTRRRTNWSTRRSPPGRQKSGASIATATGAAGVFAAAASTAARAWFSTPWATTTGWASSTTHHPTAFLPPGSNPATMATQPANHEAHDSSRRRAQCQEARSVLVAGLHTEADGAMSPPRLPASSRRDRVVGVAPLTRGTPPAPLRGGAQSG